MDLKLAGRVNKRDSILTDPICKMKRGCILKGICFEKFTYLLLFFFLNINGYFLFNNRGKTGRGNREENSLGNFGSNLLEN